MPQLKKSDALKLGLSAGRICLGEYSLLQSNISSSRETATVGSKKRKHSPTEFSMELDLEDDGETSTAPPRSNVNLSQHHEIVLPQGPNTTLNSMSQLNTMRESYPKGQTTTLNSMSHLNTMR